MTCGLREPSMATVRERSTLAAVSPKGDMQAAERFNRGAVTARAGRTYCVL